MHQSEQREKRNHKAPGCALATRPVGGHYVLSTSAVIRLGSCGFIAFTAGCKIAFVMYLTLARPAASPGTCGMS